MNDTAAAFAYLLADAEIDKIAVQVRTRSGREYAGVVGAVATSLVEIETEGVTHFVALDAIEAIVTPR